MLHNDRYFSDIHFRFSKILSADQKMMIELFREIRRIRHALEKMVPPTTDETKVIESEDSAFEFMVKKHL